MESTALKRKYFHRTERWDWLTPEMIHIVDSKAPRSITMDPWPQRIYLAATGQTTVGEFITEITRRYPAGNAPEALEEGILVELLGLVEEEKVIQLSDQPVTLPHDLLDPMSEEGTVDLPGTWHGTYYYDSLDCDPVDFTLEITRVNGNTFTGTVKDSEQGGTPGTGTITGTVTDHGVDFIKQMPIAQYWDEHRQLVIEPNKKHRPLYYSGQFSRSKQQLTGTWRFKKRWVWKGLIPYRVSTGSGTWTMKKV